MTKLHCSWQKCKTVITLSEEQEDQKKHTESALRAFGASYGVMCDFHQKVMNEKNGIMRKKWGAAWPDKMNELWKKDKKAYNKIIALAEKNVKEKKVKVSYDAHSTETAHHPCDQCKRFVSMEHFEKWQKTWNMNEDTECRDPLLCPKCGGAY